MKSILFSVLAGGIVASAAVLLPALPLNLLSDPTPSSQSGVSTLTPSLLQSSNSNHSLPLTNLPDDRFKIELSLGPALLPVNSGLVNIIYFMSIVSTQDFTHRCYPRIYSTTGYQDVQISTHTWTEARFLLWGIYYAAKDMVKFARFHDVQVEIYWEDEMVGKIKVEKKRVLNLPGEVGNSTQDLGEQIAGLSQIAGGEDATPVKPGAGNMTDSDLVHQAFSNLSVSARTTFMVRFESIAGAARLDRNEVFMTFYAAILHVAQFSAENQMESFQSDSPSGKLHLHMQEAGVGCQYGRVVTALIFVAKYMMEHSNFGYRETDFDVLLNRQRACKGTLIKGLLSEEKRGLDASRIA